MSAAAPRRWWIISPWWDMAYLVATPVLIVPVVLLLVRTRLTPEQVSLAVISFASLGHHLPGFMRAYGDRDLFARFRLRFLLAPPLAVSLALLFTPPAWLASALNLPWTHLHGLELILLLWGTWHGLMQTYGFMRIYDLRRGENVLREARLDHALCIAMFVCGVVFSDARVFGIANAMWQAGLPLFGPEWLTALRWIVGLASLMVAVLYLLNLLSRKRAREPINFIKIALACVTGWFFWYTGRLSTNLLIGLAMFEIYHAVQYYAIVWIYNRRLFERAGERFGPLGFLFRDRYSMVGVYLALIAAYSSIRYFTGDGSEYIFTAGGDALERNDAYQWLFALFVGSSLLHFYFDGFIWKVSEKKTQENLVDQPGQAPAHERYVPGLVHAGKWAVLLVLTAGLLLSEKRLLNGEVASRENAHRRALAELTPNLPEVQILRSRDALTAGDADKAVELAEQAVRLRPNSGSVHANAGVVMLGAKRYEQARELLEFAVAKNSRDWQSHTDLGLAYEQLKNPARAEASFRRAIELQPQLSEPRQHLVEFLRREGRHDEAATELAVVAQQQPNDLQTALARGDALRAAGRIDEALAEFKRATVLDSKSADANHQLGLTLLLAGNASEAIPPLQLATRYDSYLFDAHMHLGDAFYTLAKWPPAIVAYARAIELQPTNDNACVNLASAQLNAGKADAAEKTLRAGLERIPDSAKLNFTLGVLLQQTGETSEARELFDRAAELGIGGDQ